jgi:hypothetical protein
VRKAPLPGQVLTLLVVSLLVTACGNANAETVTPVERKRLPTVEHTAAQELCPSDVRDRTRRAAIRRRGEKHLREIIESFHRHRGATVRMTYATDTDVLNPGGEKTERLTILELAAQWLRDLRYEQCDITAQKQLVALPGVRERSRRPVP